VDVSKELVYQPKETRKCCGLADALHGSLNTAMSIARPGREHGWQDIDEMETGEVRWDEIQSIVATMRPNRNQAS